jgi:O-antigen ligase/tetratricopeptide (TPR) repeat protein
MTLVGVYGGLLMPLVYAPIVTFPFIFSKMLYFQILIGLTFPAWVTLASRNARYRPRASLLLWAVLAWFAAMGLSTVFAASHWRAFFGTQERMTGLFSSLHFFAWYAMAASVLRSSRDWRRLLEFQIGVGFVAACFILLQGLYPNLIAGTEGAAGERLSGLFGNPIFAASYQVFNIFFVMFLWKEASRRRRSWYGLVLVACLISLVLAGSRGPLLGLIAGLGAAALTLALTGNHRRFVTAIAIGASVLGTAYALFVVFVANTPALNGFWSTHFNLRHFFDFNIDVSRIRLWTAAWSGFVARPILGWGPASFEVIFDTFYRPEFHTLAVEDEAHNWLLGVLCETGFVGFAGVLSMWAAYFLTVVRTIRNGSLAPLAAAALIGVGVGHFIQNLFAFDTPTTQLTTFLVFAVATAAVASLQPASRTESPLMVALRRWFPFGAVPALMVAVVVVGSVLPGAASAYATRAAAAMRRAKPDEMLTLMARGQRLASPYRDDQLLIIAQSISHLSKSNKLEGWSQRGTALALAQMIADQHFANLKAHIRLQRFYANMLSVIGNREHNTLLLGKAELLYRHNLTDSPKRQVYHVDFARFLAETGRLDEAEAEFRKALALDPSVGEPLWELGKYIWTYRKRPEDGARMMAESYDDTYPPSIDKFRPGSALGWQQLAQACAKAGQIEKLRGLVNAVRDFSKRDRPTDVHLGIAGYMEQYGLLAERDQVLKFARERNPGAAPIVDPVLAGTTTLLVRHARNATKPQANFAPRTETSFFSAQEPRFSLARAP